MRIYIAFLTLLIFALSYTPILNAQLIHPHREDTNDSIAYYQKVMADMTRQTWDSLLKSEPYRAAYKKWMHYKKITNGYRSMELFGSLAQASYDVLNGQITPGGFPQIKGPIFQIGFGLSSEYHDRWILEWFLFITGLNNKSSNGGSYIQSTFTNTTQINVGYDLIKSSKINIYPYAGLALRLTSLQYSTPTQVNNNATSIIDIVQNDQSADASKLNASYQAGLGFDFVIHEGKGGAGMMLFGRAGTDRIIGNGSVNIEGVNYDPKIVQGNWAFALGIKFFIRK